MTRGTVSGGTRNHNNDCIAAVKINTDGTVAWVRQTTLMSSRFGRDELPSIAVDACGNSFIAYRTQSIVSSGTYSGGTDIVVFMMDTDGNLLWIRQTPQMNTIAIDTDPMITVSSNGAIYVSYSTAGTVSGGTQLGNGDTVVFKMDLSGTVAWIRQYANMNTAGEDDKTTIAVDSADNAYIAYQTTGTISGGTRLGDIDIVVYKLTPTGVLAWAKQLAPMNSVFQENSPSICVDNADNIYITYYSFGTISGGTNIGSGDLVIIKMNTLGNLIWTRQQKNMNTINSEITDSRAVISTDKKQNIYVGFSTNGVVSGGTNVSGSYNMALLKMDTNGNLVWIYEQPAINPTAFASNFGPSLAVTPNGEIYTCYTTTGVVSGGTAMGLDDVVIFKMIQPAPNTFTAIVNPYVTLGTVLVYTKEMVDALVEGGSGASLPATTRVSWAPLGVPAGSLLRDLGRSAVVRVSDSNPLHAYRFQRVQLIAGSDTEGVGGSLGDVDSWQTGWICTWAAGGAPPVF
jgi:hypothetical protein